MHDIDRTLMEYESGMDGYAGEFEDDYEAEYDDMEVFTEEEEIDLAAELLSVTDDEELEQFLGKLFKKVGRKLRKFVKSGTGRTLGRLLKGVAKKALPVVGGALGTVFGGPAGGLLVASWPPVPGVFSVWNLKVLVPKTRSLKWPSVWFAWLAQQQKKRLWRLAECRRKRPLKPL